MQQNFLFFSWIKDQVFLYIFFIKKKQYLLKFIGIILNAEWTLKVELLYFSILHSTPFPFHWQRYSSLPSFVTAFFLTFFDSTLQVFPVWTLSWVKKFLFCFFLLLLLLLLYLFLLMIFLLAPLAPQLWTLCS